MSAADFARLLDAEMADAERHWAEQERRFDELRTLTARAFVDSIRFDNGIRHDEGEG